MPSVHPISWLETPNFVKIDPRECLKVILISLTRTVRQTCSHLLVQTCSHLLAQSYSHLLIAAFRCTARRTARAPLVAPCSSYYVHVSLGDCHLIYLLCSFVDYGCCTEICDLLLYRNFTNAFTFFLFIGHKSGIQDYGNQIVQILSVSLCLL